MTNPDWRDDAQCAGLPIATFDINTYDKTERNDVARRICQGCPVITECRTDVLEHRDHNYAIIVAGVAIPDFGDDRARRTALEAIRDGRFLKSPKPRLKARSQKPVKTPVKPKPRPQNCVTCGWKLAPSTTRDETCPPDHRIHYAHGVCRTCRSEATGGVHGPAMKFKHCIDCGEPMRSNRKALVDAPGTVIHKGGGRCEQHYYLHRKAEKAKAAKDAA